MLNHAVGAEEGVDPGVEEWRKWSPRLGDPMSAAIRSGWLRSQQTWMAARRNGRRIWLGEATTRHPDSCRGSAAVTSPLSRRRFVDMNRGGKRAGERSRTSTGFRPPGPEPGSHRDSQYRLDSEDRCYNWGSGRNLARSMSPICARLRTVRLHLGCRGVYAPRTSAKVAGGTTGVQSAARPTRQHHWSTHRHPPPGRS